MERLIEFSTNHWYYVVALAVTLGMLAHTFIAPHFRKYRDISPMEATGLINREEGLVLDVRESHEYSAGHVGGAVHIPLARLASRVGELEGYRERPLIVVCKTGSRSGSACNTLVKNGFGRVFALRGGMAEWQGANLPITRSDKKKKKRKGKA